MSTHKERLAAQRRTGVVAKPKVKKTTKKKTTKKKVTT